MVVVEEECEFSSAIIATALVASQISREKEWLTSTDRSVSFPMVSVTLNPTKFCSALISRDFCISMSSICSSVALE